MKSLQHLAFCAVLTLAFGVITPSASALTISPVKVEVTGDPGQTLHGEVELLNEQAIPKVLYASYENFEPSGETGSPKFVGGSSGLATWLAAEPRVSVAPGESVKVPYTITIPTSAEAGGYFAAVFWGEEDPGLQQAGEVAIGGKLGVLILLRVSGTITESAGISDFGLGSSSRLRTSLPITFSYRFKNDGGDRVVPLGDIVITNTFGMQTASIPANVTEGSVLPNSARRFQSTWGTPLKDGDDRSFLTIVKSQASNFHLGLYKATVSVTYGTTNLSASESLRFFVFPWQLLSLCSLALVAFIFAFKRYNAWIIAKSKSRE